MSGPERFDVTAEYPHRAGKPHRLACYAWGDSKNPPVLCIHGLTRNGRDFDFLAEGLADRFHVIAVDMPGRGLSERLPEPEDYALANYVHDIHAVLSHLQLQNVHWVGTSMGGMLGMVMAAQAPALVRSLALNDVGAFIPAAALARLSTYVGKAVKFADRAQAEAALRVIYEPFGIREERVWQNLFTHSLRTETDGSITLAYDPAIGNALNAAPPQDVDLWALWSAVQCPVLVIRGEVSDILNAETARKMLETKPGAMLHTVPGVGHAPTLTDAAEIGVVREWLVGHS